MYMQTEAKIRAHIKYSKTEKGKIANNKACNNYRKTKKGRENQYKATKRWYDTNRKSTRVLITPEEKKEKAKLYHLAHYIPHPRIFPIVSPEQRRIKRNESRIKYTRKIKLEAYNILGGMKCCKCNVIDERVLQLDHINGGGRKMGHKGKDMYRKIVNDPEWGKKIFQVLCANCNWIKRYENKECLLLQKGG